MDIAKLLRCREPSESDLRAVRTTLQLLGDWEYRRKDQMLKGTGLVTRLSFYDLTTEARSYVYGLSQKGVRLDWQDLIVKTLDEHSARTLDHELELSWFLMAVVDLCKKNGWQYYFQRADLKTKTIHPDIYLSISKGDDKWHHFFVERERSKLSSYEDGEPSILRKKIPAYYKLFDTAECEKEWDFRQFRVIVIQSSDKRSRNLCAALREKFNHRMFWLTTEEKCRADIGGEIFATPKDFEKVGYSFTNL